MKKPRFQTLFLSFFVILSMFFTVGHSAFITEKEMTLDDLQVSQANRAVCFNPGTKEKFTSIEKALEVAKKNSGADTIYVIPGTNPTITRDCEIAFGDTLCLPYEADVSNLTATWENREGQTALKNRFADDCESMVAQNRKSTVKINRGTTLIVNGTLNIGGILGNRSSGSQGLQGQTSGSYAEILMETGSGNVKGATIDVKGNGKIDCRGYIKETSISDDPNIQSQLILGSTSSLILPFVIYDYQGAMATGGIFCPNNTKIGASDIGKTLRYAGEACPFVLFDMPNIQILTTIKSGSVVTGLVSLHTDERKIAKIFNFEESWNTDQFTLVGASNSLLSLTSGYLTVRYKPANPGYTEVLNYVNNPTRTTVDFYGKATFGSMKMTLNAQVAKVEIDTAGILFPFSYRWAFNIKENASVDVSNGIKFMNGCSLNIEKGGSLNLNQGARAVFYNQQWIDHKTTIPYLPVYAKDGSEGTVAEISNIGITTNLVPKTTTPEITGNADLINNGTIHVKNGAAIGGLVRNNIGNGLIIMESGSSSTVQSLETNGKGEFKIDWSFTGLVLNKANPQTLTENAKADVLNDSAAFSKTVLSTGNYEAIELNDSYGFGKSDDTATITGDKSILSSETKIYSIDDSSTTISDENLIWSSSNESILSLNSTTGKQITVTGHGSGKATLICRIKNKGTVAIKRIYVGRYVDTSVIFDTSEISDDQATPFRIGGIGDYRDIKVTLDTNCTNYELDWSFDTSKLRLESKSESYPTFTYRFRTIDAGNDTLKLNFSSNEITKNNCWTQDLSIANNKRVKKFEVITEKFSKKVSIAKFEEFDHISDLNVDGDLTSISWKYVKEATYVKVTSVTLENGKLKIHGKGQAMGVSSHYCTIYVYSKNGVNGSKIKSKTLTIEVTN